ncbi:MAG: hypothetical protein GQ526_10405 [Ardenticatenales bacterium]|nr:hypothetical protein [Ardenticatenales bacterium]
MAITVAVLFLIVGIVIVRLPGSPPTSSPQLELPTLVQPDTPTKQLSPAAASPTLIQSGTLIRPSSLTPTSPMPVSLTPDAPVFASPTSIPIPSATPTATPLPFEGPFVYGSSAGGRELLVYRLGTGPSARALVGGIHGGYEWNTTVLMSDTLDYLMEHLDQIPDHTTLYIIPCANPDGFAAGTDAVNGRMNGNGVDLNRNWAYQWQMTATHGTRPVYAGTGPFSEPETAALRDFILDRQIEAAIFYHSAMGKIFSGADRTRSATHELAEKISQVTGYPHAPEGVPGQITTGDAIDYLSTRGIAAIEIELTTHKDIDWEWNRQGVSAFLKWTIPDAAIPDGRDGDVATLFGLRRARRDRGW